MMIGAVVALLAGCAIAPATSGAGTHTPSATPTKDAAAPRQVCGGDCAAAFPLDRMRAATSANLIARRIDVTSDLDAAAIATVGGLQCQWSEARDSGTYLTLTVLPASVPVADVAASSCDVVGEGQARCFLDVVSHDVWLSADLQGRIELTKADLDPAVVKLTTLLGVAAASAVQPVSRLSQAEDVWSAEPDCQKLGEAANAGAAIASPSLTTIDTETGMGDQAAGVAAAREAAGFGRCAWFQPGGPVEGESSGFEVVILPAGDWLKRAVEALPSARVVTVNGADAAFDVGARGNQPNDVLYLFSGSNLLTVQSTDRDVSNEQTAPAAVEVLRVLGATAGD